MDKHTFKLMLVIAVIADALSAGISLIPFIGQVANPLFTLFISLSFWLWFAMKGLGFQGALGGGAGALVESIPFLQVLPSFTAMVVAIYIRNKATEAVSKVPGGNTAAKAISRSSSGKVVGSVAPKPSTSIKKVV